MNPTLNSRGKLRVNELHGMSLSPEYLAWRGMRERCQNPNNPNYARYGGRGIAVFEAWNESFMAFYRHVGPRPTSGHSIDRIDNSRGYEPGNVRWATKVVQQQNMRMNVRLTHNGETYCLREWERRSGVPYNTIRLRMMAGLSSAEILSPAVKRDPALRGVYRMRSGRWQAVGLINRTGRAYLGTFGSPGEAAARVREWELSAAACGGNNR